jgi:dolichyl-diphosphooligosaccharide--protein glycosyltransferase
MGRFNNRLYTAYSSWYVLGTVASMQVPFVEYLPIRTSEHMAALGVFGLLQLVAFVEIVRKMVPGRQFQMLLRAFVVLVFGVSFTVLVLLTFSGWIAPWTGRFYSLWDTGYAKVHSKLFDTIHHTPGLTRSANHCIGFRTSTYRLACILLRSRDAHLLLPRWCILVLQGIEG